MGQLLGDEVDAIVLDEPRRLQLQVALEQPDELVDAIGDALVTIIILADILNLDPIGCLEEAYDAIAERKGETKNGTFVKAEE